MPAASKPRMTPVNATLLKALIEMRLRLIRQRTLSKVWVFNNMPAGARVDTKVSCPLPGERAWFAQ
jgi:hypothetical protein